MAIKAPAPPPQLPSSNNLPVKNWKKWPWTRRGQQDDDTTASPAVVAPEPADQDALIVKWTGDDADTTDRISVTPHFLLGPGAFLKNDGGKYAISVLDFVLRPTPRASEDALVGFEMGRHPLALPKIASEERSEGRDGNLVAIVGPVTLALETKKQFPGRTLVAIVTDLTQEEALIAVAGEGISLVSDIRHAAELIRRASDVVTDWPALALTAAFNGVRVDYVGLERANVERAIAEASRRNEADERIDACAAYGFVRANDHANIAGEEAVVAWFDHIGAKVGVLVIEKPLQNLNFSHIVVGSPKRAVKPFSRHFGATAWQMQGQNVASHAERAGDGLASCDLVLYNRDDYVGKLGSGKLGRAKRVFDRIPVDYPLMLTLTNVFIPAFGCHRFKANRDKFIYALGDDVNEMSDEVRANHAREGARLRPLLKRLQTSRRLARHNKIEMGRRFGPLGFERALVLGAEEDQDARFWTNPDCTSDLDVIRLTLSAHPTAKVLYLPQKKAAADTAHVASVKKLSSRVEVIPADVSISELAHVISCVKTVDSLLGVFAIVVDLPVTVYGRPPYAGLGVTRDVSALGTARKLDVDKPLTVDEFLGWYFTKCALFADCLTGEPIHVEQYLWDWAPYLGELSDEIADRLVDYAPQTWDTPGDFQKLLLALSTHAKSEQLGRLIADLDPLSPAARNLDIMIKIALISTIKGDWRGSVSKLHDAHVIHGKAAQKKLKDAFVQLRAQLNSVESVDAFCHFLLSKFRFWSTDDYQSLGDAYREKGYFRTALFFYSTCSVSNALLRERTRCYIGIGDLPQAERHIARLKAMKEPAESLEDLQLNLLERANRHAEMIPILQKKAAAAPRDLDLSMRLAQALVDCGKLEEAIAILLRLMRSKKGVAAVRLLASVYISQMEPTKARGLLEGQLDLSPHDAKSWGMLGECYSFENNLEQAAQCLYTALTLSPLDIALHTQLTEIEAELEKSSAKEAKSEVREKLTDALDRLVENVDQSTLETLIGQGRARLQLHDFECLKRNCQLAMNLYPEDSRPYLWYAHAFAWEMTEKAPEILSIIRQNYKAVIARDPDSTTWALLDAIRSLAKIGDLDAVRELVEEHRFALFVGDKERFVIPRYSAALALGDFAAAFDAMRYLARTRVIRRNTQGFRFALSLKDVKPNDKLLLLSEGGVGDEIRYSALYPELVARKPDATISVDERLVTLFERTYPMVKRFEPLPRYHRKRLNRDHKQSISGLPDRDLAPFFDTNLWKIATKSDVILPVPCTLADLRQSPADFEAGRRVRLTPRPDLVEQWRARLSPYRDRVIIGATWTSMFREYQRVENYLSHEEMAPLFKLPGVIFVNCQYEDIESELAWVRGELGVEILDFPELDKRDDFEGLSALLSVLDLFVGTATTTTELAAMAGCPTIYASPSPLNAYRNPPDTEYDLFHEGMKIISPKPWSDRASMIMRIQSLLAEAVSLRSAFMPSAAEVISQAWRKKVEYEH